MHLEAISLLVWPLIVTLGLSALLMWLGGSLSAIAAPAGATSPRTGSVATLFTGVGLWWPLYLAWSGNRAASVESWLHVGLLALCAFAAAATADFGARQVWRSPRRIVAFIGAAAAAAIGLTVVSGLASTPPGINFALGAGIAAALVVLAARPPGTRAAVGWRVIPATVVASLAVAQSLRPAAAASSSAFDPTLLPMLVLAGLGVGLWFTQRRQKAEAEAAATRSPAEFDPLTQLPTRMMFENSLAAAVRGLGPGRGELAVMLVNLDGFKVVNDSFGHTQGDRILRTMSRRLRAVVDPGGVLARIGSDEFLLLLSGKPVTDKAQGLARRMIDAVARPVAIGQREHTLSCSIGIAVLSGGEDSSRAIARAGAAMRAAKSAGGKTHRLFDTSMDSDDSANLEMVSDLRRALERSGELELQYQPKIDTKSGQITAVEALLRWNHPVRGAVQPGVFVPLAERFGLIGELGLWIIDEACRQAREWADRGLRMRVAINLSPQQLRQPDLVVRIVERLKRVKLDPGRLTCEITETLAMEDTPATQENLRMLGAAGIHLSIDDFGTGYSSLAYLRKLPAAELKIDRSFVMDIEHSADARAIVDAVIRLAHALGKKVVAEGVENVRQQKILVGLGCDELQGYLFAQPMTARALLLWALDDRRGKSEGFRSSLFVTREMRTLITQQSNSLPEAVPQGPQHVAQ
jgi:diguanylate cyclase (GGDEF)-like protein